MIRNKNAALLFSALTFFLIFSILFSGCSKKENSEIVGKWVPTSANINGSALKYSDLGLEDSYFEFVFNENGSCTATLAGIKNTGTYVFNETSVDVIINKETRKLTYENGILTLTFSYENNDNASFSFIKDQETNK